MTLSKNRPAGISALIHTKNEEGYIAQALASVAPYVDEMVVVDMHSSDRTRTIAENLGARVELVSDFGFVEPARELGVGMCRHEWILNLDADEVITPALGSHLAEISRNNSVDVVRIARVNYMFGQMIQGSGWSPARDSHMKFYRHDSLVHSPVLHAYSVPVRGARISTLEPVPELAIHHFNYLGWDQFVSKMNRYTSITATERHGRGERPSLRRAAARAAKDVATRLVLDRGYRDGADGFALAYAMASYHLLVHVKHRQLTRVGDTTSIRERYRAAAESLRTDSETGSVSVTGTSSSGRR